MFHERLGGTPWRDGGPPFGAPVSGHSAAPEPGSRRQAASFAQSTCEMRNYEFPHLF